MYGKPFGTFAYDDVSIEIYGGETIKNYLNFLTATRTSPKSLRQCTPPSLTEWIRHCQTAFHSMDMLERRSSTRGILDLFY